jgi:hypothetical protein
MMQYARWSRFEKIGGVILAFFFSFMFCFVFFSAFVNCIKSFESRFFPVMENTIIINAENVGIDGQAITRLEITSNKVRDCDKWLSVEWYLGKIDGRSARVPSEFKDRPQIRPTGEHHWKNLFVSLPENLIRQSSYGVVKHDCHGWWDTETIFYVGNEGKA